MNLQDNELEKQNHRCQLTSKTLSIWRENRDNRSAILGFCDEVQPIYFSDKEDGSSH